MVSGVDQYTVIYEKAPVKMVVFRLDEEMFWYLNSLVLDDSHSDDASKRALWMMNEIKAEIMSHD